VVGKARRPKVKVFPRWFDLGARRRRTNPARESKAGWREGIAVSVLARAIEKRQWELAALCLVLGLMKALSRLPDDSMIGLFDVLDGGEDGNIEE